MTASEPDAMVNGNTQRPKSMMVRPHRSSSRMSLSAAHQNNAGVSSGREPEEDPRTAVKVAVRVRPPLQPSDPGYDLVPQRFRGSTIQVSNATNLTVETSQVKKPFVFDRVFGEDIDQEGVWDYLGESIDSFVQGYNVSVLAYGQSGSGKSYTMGTTGFAEQNDPEIMGVVPRAAAALFEKLAGNTAPLKKGIKSPARYSTNGVTPLQNAPRSANKNWQLKATYVEIYQEHLRDLLLDESVPFGERPQVMIREDPKGKIFLTGLRQVPIESVEDLLNALNFGSSIRQTDATAVNARSSRSHAVFSLNLIQKKTTLTMGRDKRRSVPLEAMSGNETWVTLDSKLHFVDLAGSERLKNTGALGERAREGISINAGLASLGKVIAQLSSRHPSAHVSYRDSKLTRLLQDSLGGNAITYMIACVNPVEFHLSETLNTVQYAQRARAIQIKPQIQQINDDGDKQAVIDRLRAEVSFLRDQIRLSDRSERRSIVPKDREERSHGREVELQNQLLDVQENYNSLSQRHAKLISEITKASDADVDDTPVLKDTVGDSAVERLKRSNSFAEAADQMILEYEKTIQSLETNLSNTKTNLNTTESALLEKETKVTFMENMTQQLNSRLHKALDREANDDHYLRDLESRVAGAATGEDKHTAIIASMRKELTRARENESSCEEYISTLEERITEAEQDHEMMQREIDRLEHVVERQRSIGKLDNLLYELDNIRQGDGKNGAVIPISNGHSQQHEEKDSSEDSSSEGLEEDDDESSVEEKSQRKSVAKDEHVTHVSDVAAIAGTPRPKPKDILRVREKDEPTSPAQQRFVADKLETVSQELFSLRVDHESTVHDFDELQRKYQVALHTLAELQDSVEDARRHSRPTSYIANGMQNGGGVQPPGRSLSSELSKRPDSSNSEYAGSERTSKGVVVPLPITADRDENIAQEMKKLQALNTEKDHTVAELTEIYSHLQEKHQDTLDYVEELKVEVQKAQMAGRGPPSPQIIRRKSSQNISNSDRAARSFAALRNLAVDHFEGEPDLVQSFELNLNAAMTELHIRSDRVVALEGEIASMRKEMETKMTIITGLTRERSSLTASSPLDIPAIASMRDQLLHSETRMRELSEAHSAREQDLRRQIDSLREAIPLSGLADAPSTPTTTSRGTVNSPSTNGSRRDSDSDHQHRIAELQREVSTWREKHDDAISCMKSSEQQLLSTISELESTLHGLESQAVANRAISPDADRAGVTPTAIMQERKGHQAALAALQKEVVEHKTNAAATASRLAELQDSHSEVMHRFDADAKSRELTEQELHTHRELVVNLESQLDEHKAAIDTHQQALLTLQENHADEIERLAAASQKNTDNQVSKVISEHEASMQALQVEVERAQAMDEKQIASLKTELQAAKEEMEDLCESASMLFKKPTDASNLTTHIQSNLNARKDILALHETATNELQDVRRQLETSKQVALSYQRKFEQSKSVSDDAVKELDRVAEKERKNARLIEELEEQLNSNFDQHKAANNRLSAMQAQRLAQMDEMRRELDESRGKIAMLDGQLTDARRRSFRESMDPNKDHELTRTNSGSNGNLRKSVSAGSLPSPPPAIPLPPLPGNYLGGAQTSPPTSRHQSKDIAHAQLVEDQEARIRTIEKHLVAEKQLTATLEEALQDLEQSSTKMKSEMEAWRHKCLSLEEDLNNLRKQRESSRLSVQQLEEERNKSKALEQEQRRLQHRLEALASNKPRKKGGLNCF